MLARYTNKDLMICKNLKGTENYKNMKKKQKKNRTKQKKIN
jgi:hypothetical protein